MNQAIWRGLKTYDNSADWFFLFIVILSLSRPGQCALIKSDSYCLPVDASANGKPNNIPIAANSTKDEIELKCPAMSRATVNVFELRFMVNKSCWASTTSGGRPRIDSKSNYSIADKASGEACQAKSIRGTNLLDCYGTQCSLRQIKAIKVCGVTANQMYALYECLPVVLDRSLVWSRNDPQVNANGKETMGHSDDDSVRQLTCPSDTTIVVTRAVAIVGHLANPRCWSQEPFSTQIGRMCCPICHTCNVSMISPGLRCKQRLMRNEYSIVNYSCIPKMDHFRDIRQYTLCDTKRIESNVQTSGFIVSPNYPLAYPANMQCNMVLVSGLPMRLYLLSFDVIYPHSLSIQINTVRRNKINLYAKDKMPRLLVNNASEITLEFLSNFIAGKGNVRLYFSNIDPLQELDTRVTVPDEDITQFAPTNSGDIHRENGVLETYGHFLAPKPAVMIYILSGATLILVLSSIILLIATFTCPYDRLVLKYKKRSNRRCVIRKSINAGPQESHQKLLFEYGTYEELNSQPPLYSYVNLPKRRTVDKTDGFYYESGRNVPFTATHCIHCCPHCCRVSSLLKEGNGSDLLLLSSTINSKHRQQSSQSSLPVVIRSANNSDGLFALIANNSSDRATSRAVNGIVNGASVHSDRNQVSTIEINRKM